jgi:hypothetical protein
MTRPLLSIAIPQRNRPSNLLYAVHDVLSCTQSDFELVFQESSDDDVLRSEVERQGDPRASYTHTLACLLVVQSCDFATQTCAKQCVYAVGDDDRRLLKEPLELVARCLTEASAVASWRVSRQAPPLVAHEKSI